MLENILKLLNMDSWNFTGDETIRIAKGKYELPLTKEEKKKRLRDTIAYARYTFQKINKEYRESRFLKKIKRSLKDER